MNVVATQQPAPERRCPKCRQPLRPAIPDAPVKSPAAPVKHYALEQTFGIKRMNGGFV